MTKQITRAEVEKLLERLMYTKERGRASREEQNTLRIGELKKITV